MGAFNGSGTFVRSYNWVTDAANGVNITASRVDTEDDGYAAGLTNCITRDGQGGPTANISWNGYNLTNVTVTMLTGSTVADSGGTAHTVGYRGVPQDVQSSAVILNMTQVGKHVYISTGGVTIPLNATVAFPIETAITIVNNSDVAQTVAGAVGVTLRLAGSLSTGSRGLAGRGIGTLIKTAADEWYFVGAGVS